MTIPKKTKRLTYCPVILHSAFIGQYKFTHRQPNVQYEVGHILMSDVGGAVFLSVSKMPKVIGGEPAV